LLPRRDSVDFEIKGDSLIIREDDREELVGSLLVRLEIRVSQSEETALQGSLRGTLCSKTDPLIFNMDLRETRKACLLTRNYFPYLWQ
jgi:hypothetical protein